MRRYDAIGKLVSVVPQDTPIISTLGDTCKELHHIADRPSNFYMLGSFGLASSIGLGVALSQRRKVVVLEGDAGILTNMGSLATIGRYGGGNLILVIFDNGSCGTTGNQPTATSVNCDIAAVARSCGINKVEIVGSLSLFEKALTGALEQDEVSLVLVKISTEKPQLPIVDMDGSRIRERFMRRIINE